MPVEIKKLVLQAKVVDPEPSEQSDRGLHNRTISEAQMQAITERTVKAVLKAIKREKTR
jgi:hypothetical protein